MSSGHVRDREPHGKRQRVRRAGSRQPPALQADIADDLMSPLERHLESTGVAPDDPGRRLARSLASSSGAAMLAAASAGEDKCSVAPRSSGHTEGRRGVAPRSLGHTDFIEITANIHVASDDVESQEVLSQFRQAQAFFADRVETVSAKAFLAHKPKVKQRAALEKRGKLLFYNKVSEGLQKLLDAARLKEWGNYKKYGAAKIISRQEAERIVGLGAEELPTQWIERDKNEFLRNDSDAAPVEPDMRSRLVARGDLSKVWARSDSPTADKESVFLVLSFAACRGLMVESGDLENGYFQGERLQKPLVLKQPSGGVPEPGIAPDDRLLAFVPIYGTKDAGRGLWRRLRKVFVSLGLKEKCHVGSIQLFS